MHAIPPERLHRVDKPGAVAAALTFLSIVTDVAVTALPGKSDIAPGTLSARGWFTLLHDKPLLGLRNLGLLNVVNMLLSIPLFAALLAAHGRTRPRIAVLATGLQLVGLGVYIANNRAISMLALSHRREGFLGESSAGAASSGQGRW